MFLALAAELSPLERLPVLLDDVVMAVDKGHRKQFATVLCDELSEYFQLLVTTHDAGWPQQLVASEVARDENVIRFTGWTPGAGPTVDMGFE